VVQQQMACAVNGDVQTELKRVRASLYDAKKIKLALDVDFALVFNVVVRSTRSRIASPSLQQCVRPLTNHRS
jgi:hypothetical protein